MLPHTFSGARVRGFYSELVTRREYYKALISKLDGTGADVQDYVGALTEIEQLMGMYASHFGLDVDGKGVKS